MRNELKSEIIIYKPKGRKVELKVRLEKESLWLTQKQISDLFKVDRTVITKHINNIFDTKELPDKSNVQKMHIAFSDKPTAFYSLDVIISIGYRVNSKRGTQFRIWAAQVLKDHIIKGYSINAKRLKEQNERLFELQKTINLMGHLLDKRELDNREAKGLLKVITDYSYALSVLDQYDRDQLKIQATTRKKEFIITYNRALLLIEKLGQELVKQNESIGFFGRQKDNSFKGSISAIYQTFDGKELYPSIEEKAAHLLYFLVKDHSFIDGNKRIGAFLFIWFMDANGILYSNNGNKRIGDNALVALTLLIAESNPKEKDTIIKVIINLINKNN